MRKIKLMVRMYFVLFTLIQVLYIPILQGQDIDEIIENIYQKTLIHEGQLDSLENYSFVQKIHFTKLDGDDEVEEQSKREFIVRVQKKEIRHRELIVALDLKDEQWVDVFEKEKNKRETESKSVKFSLTEMVSPENRTNYKFSVSGEEIVDGINSLHIHVKPLEEDEDKFTGDMWFEKDTYALVKAVLVPSEFPTAVEDMVMEFSMRKIEDIWLPVKINFEAEVSFLFIFKGKIVSDILFEDYLFEQVFADSLFRM